MELDRCARRPKDSRETLHILHGHDRIVPAGSEERASLIDAAEKLIDLSGASEAAPDADADVDPDSAAPPAS